MRLEAYARSLGCTARPIAEEVKGLKPKPIVVIPASEISRSDFAHLTDSEFSKLQYYYGTAEKGELYPPACHNPHDKDREGCRGHSALHGSCW